MGKVWSSDTYFGFLGRFTTILGWVVGWMGEIEDKVHLSPAEAKTRLGCFDVTAMLS